MLLRYYYKHDTLKDKPLDLLEFTGQIEMDLLFFKFVIFHTKNIILHFFFFYTLGHDRATDDALSLEVDNRRIHSNVEINNIGLVLSNINNMQFRSW